jgi:hypothetical protein
VALASHESPAMGDPDHYPGCNSFPGATGSFCDDIGPGEGFFLFAQWLVLRDAAPHLVGVYASVAFLHAAASYCTKIDCCNLVLA